MPRIVNTRATYRLRKGRYFASHEVRIHELLSKFRLPVRGEYPLLTGTRRDVQDTSRRLSLGAHGSWVRSSRPQSLMSKWRLPTRCGPRAGQKQIFTYVADQAEGTTEYSVTANCRAKALRQTAIICRYYHCMMGRQPHCTQDQ